VYVRDRHSGEALRGLAAAGGRVVVIGSGFIGCEAAASLSRRGIEVVLVTDETLPHAARLGEEVGARIADWLRAEGVDLILQDGAAAVRSSGNSWEVELASGRTLLGNGVVSGSGARPNLALAESAGVKIDNGGVAPTPNCAPPIPRSGPPAISRTRTTRPPIGTSGSSTGARPRPWVRSSVRTSPESISAGPSRPDSGQPSVIIN
jgi:hypothetical protein